MCEGLSYLAGAELPCVVVNVSRGGPGLGTIQPSQADYFQAVKGGGHGDYHLIVLAPNSVQEMYDFVPLGFELAFKYRNPVMILSDGVIGQMMEKVMLTEPRPRWSDAYIAEHWGGWATTGKPADRKRNIVTSVELDPLRQERFNLKLSKSTGRSAKTRCATRPCSVTMPITYWSLTGLPRVFPRKRSRAGSRGGTESRTATAGYALSVPDRAIDELSQRVKGFLSVEMSTGQMIEDVQLAARCRVPVFHFGRTGGVVHSPSEVLEALKRIFSLK